MSSPLSYRCGARAGAALALLGFPWLVLLVVMVLLVVWLVCWQEAGAGCLWEPH